MRNMFWISDGREQTIFYVCLNFKDDNIIIMYEDISDISIDDSDDEQIYGAPDVYAERPDPSFNDTAESLKEKNELDKK